MSALLDSCKLLDESSSALSTIAVVVAALSCEAARANLSAFDLTDSGDGSVAKDDIGVASDIKVLLNGSKLVASSNKGDDKINIDSFSKIPVVNGNVREAVKSLHSVIRVVSNTGDKLGGKVLHLGFELRNLGESSLERVRLNLGSVGIEGIKGIFEKDCLSEESLRNGVQLAVEAGLEKDYLKLVKEVDLVLGIVWKIVAWEAVTAFFVLEGGEVLSEKSGGKGGEADGGNVKVEKKKKKKILLGKGTSFIVEVIKDSVMSMVEGLEKVVEDLLSFLDPKSPEFDGLLKKMKEILESNESRRIPKTPKGTRDFAKEQMAIRKKAFSIITKVFERHCATALDTPAFELKETLTGKYGEDSKLIYDLADQGGELCSLRYDLTVPFSRYVAMNGLTSFKRYHIDKVWRRDNPSKGRYREFYQCDFDIAGQYEKMGPDFEVVRILSEVLNSLNIGDYEIKLNHRKLLDGVLEICGVPPAKFRTICSSIDKLDKQSFEQVKKEMVEEKGLSVETADKIGTFVKIRGPPLELLSKIMGGSEGTELLKHNASKEALGDLSVLFEALDKSRCIDKVVFDLSLARGLDYYTGVIFEAAFKGGVQVGSIGAGGRYDNLIGNFGTKQVPAVGMSLGIVEKFNVTDRLVLLFPKIDVDPADGFVTENELTEWNLQQAAREVLHRTQREMEIHDKNHDGLISYKEYEPPSWVKNDNTSFGYDMGWWKEEHFNASDADGDGLLNITEFNDFLHPADSKNSKLLKWLCKEEVRERDTDKDGKVNFNEFFHGLFDLVRNYDEEGHNSSHPSDDSMEAPAKRLFSQLDKDGDRFLSDEELLPIIGKLHPSERYYAKQQADYIISQADSDKDGRLSLVEMIDSPYVFYSAIFNDDEDEDDYEYHDEFR